MSQLEVIKRLLSDGKAHSAYELARAVAEQCYNGARDIEHGLRIGARIWDLRKHGLDIEGFRDKDNPQKYYYQLKPQQELFPR